MHNQRHPYRALWGLMFFCCLMIQASSQTIRSFNQNSSRSNNAKALISNDDRWLIGLRSGGSFGMKSAESNLFRGSGIGSDLYAHYYFGPFGLGMTSGWMQGNLSNSAINQFLTDRKYPSDALITKGNPSNSYLLFGPSVRFGNKVQLTASLQGGIFMNHSGRLIIAQNGAQRPLYRFDEGSKNMAAGFSGEIQAAYPINASTKFTLHTGYLQSRSSTLLLDPQGGIDQPREFNKDLHMLNASIGISKNLGSSKRVLPTVNKKEILSPRDAQSGQSTGRRKDITIDESGVHRTATGGRNNITIDESGVHRMIQDNNPACGPVTIKTTNADGTANEMTFACPADAAAYQQRISMNVTVPKQTQGATFGEKVQSGLAQTGSALANGTRMQPSTASRVIAGRIRLSGNNTYGIETNQSVSAVSSTGMSGGSGASSAAYAATGRMADNNYCGTTSHFLVRDAQTGQASGKTAYEIFYSEKNGIIHCTACSANISKPVSKAMSNVNSNPMYVEDGRIIAPASLVPVQAGVEVRLTDPNTAAVLATTVTEPDGTFFFINVPEGIYNLDINANLTIQKDYTVELDKKKDLAGILSAEADKWLIDISTATGGMDVAQAIIKTKTKSNQSNDRTAGSGVIWSPRSNLIALPVTGGDLDGDGEPEFSTREYFQTGDKPTQEQFLQYGQPVAGIKIKMLMGGTTSRTTQTNRFGEFEFTGLEAGTYTISTTQTFRLRQGITINMNDEGSLDQNIVTSESNLKGDARVTASQNSQSLRSVNNINNSMPNRISMNFTVARQTQQSSFGEKVKGVIEADTDGDGNFETSWMNYSGEVATFTFSGNGTTLTGLNISEPGSTGTPAGALKTVAPTTKIPIKWSAPEVLKLRHVSGDPHVDQKDGRLAFSNDPANDLPKEKWRGTPVAVKTITAGDGVALIITAHPEDIPDAIATINGLPPGVPILKAELILSDNNGREIKSLTDNQGACRFSNVPTNVPLGLRLNFQVAADEDVIIILRENSVFSSISNVLKTKHDTVKNSISNIR